jgi:tetratricopeptide (TPR) repeat protein
MGLPRLGSPLSWREELERSVGRERLRRRALAFAGIWFLLAGFTVALGIWIFLAASLALTVVGGLAIAALALVQHDGTRERASGLAQSVERASRNVDGRVSDLKLRERAQRSVTTASRRARTLKESRRIKPTDDPGRRARRLNMRGVELRREQEYEQAVDHHRAALTVARELGDRRAEALTLNNLALALVHTDGGVPEAIQDFERARELLRELGDEELEGQVIANLASVRRRQGRDEDAETLLQAALDKLPEESSAYRQVEEQLRRAS